MLSMHIRSPSPLPPRGMIPHTISWIDAVCPSSEARVPCVTDSSRLWYSMLRSRHVLLPSPPTSGQVHSLCISMINEWIRERQERERERGSPFGRAQNSSAKIRIRRASFVFVSSSLLRGASIDPATYCANGCRNGVITHNMNSLATKLILELAHLESAFRAASATFDYLSVAVAASLAWPLPKFTVAAEKVLQRVAARRKPPSLPPSLPLLRRV